MPDLIAEMEEQSLQTQLLLPLTFKLDFVDQGYCCSCLQEVAVADYSTSHAYLLYA